MQAPHNFIPDYEFIVGRPEKLNNLVIPSSIVNPNKIKQGVNGVTYPFKSYNHSPDGYTLPNGDYYDFNTIPAKYISIKNLQLAADIPQLKEQGKGCKFIITNLSNEDVNFIRKDDSIIFRAGYKSIRGNDLPDLFIGQVQRVITAFDGVDRVTTIDCAEGHTLRKNSRISYHWPPMTTRASVIRTFMELISKQGIPTGGFILPNESTEEYKIINSPYYSGFSVHGNTLQELTKICEACRMRCYVLLGRLYVEPAIVTGNPPRIPVTTLKTHAVFRVTPDKVKGQVQPKSGNSTNAPSNSDGGKGLSEVSITLYLNSDVSLNKIVTLSGFTTYDGDYSVTSLRHKYNHRNGGCETVLTLKGLSNGS